MPDNIQTYQWTGINKQGKRLKGKIQSTDTKAVEQELRSREIEVISVKPQVQSTFAQYKNKVKLKDIVLFTRYLGTMLTAGMPILQALEVLARDQENQGMRSIIVSLQSNISTGTTFADSLSQYPNSFNQLYCNIVSAGEKSGTLDKVLTRLAKYLEKIETLKRKIKTALIYPVTILGIASVVSLVLLLFVIPKFQVLFNNAHVKLPYFTQLVINFSYILREYWWLILIIIIGMIWSFRYLKKNNQAFAAWLDDKSLKIYIIGPILQKGIIARFTSTLAITLDAGLPIVESMHSMINIMGNRRYSRAIEQICEDLSSGYQLSVAMTNTKMFPTMVVQMIAVGEASGELPAMLNNVANAYQEEVDSIANNLSTLLEPLVIAVLGLIIGGFVIAMYLPIFKLGSTI